MLKYSLFCFHFALPIFNINLLKGGAFFNLSRVARERENRLTNQNRLIFASGPLGFCVCKFSSHTRTTRQCSCSRSTGNCCNSPSVPRREPRCSNCRPQSRRATPRVRYCLTVSPGWVYFHLFSFIASIIPPIIFPNSAIWRLVTS